MNYRGGIILRSGYRYVKVSGHPMAGKQGYYAEHRLVMEKSIGRYLTKKEVVHHKDGDRINNDLNNLELMPSAGHHTKFCHPEVTTLAAIINRGVRRSIRTEFKKGVTPWNKGTRGVMKAWNKGIKGSTCKKLFNHFIIL